MNDSFKAEVQIKRKVVVEIAVYDNISQYYSEEEQCWVQRDPSYIRMGMYDISEFHDVTKEERYKAMCSSIKFPTEFCTMKFYGNERTLNSDYGSNWIFVVGNAKENNKKLQNLRERYNAVCDKWNHEINHMQNEYEDIMNAGD